MLRNALLGTRLSLAVYRAAVDEGFVTLTTPRNAFERKQLMSLARRMKPTFLPIALTHCLIAEEIHLDCTSFGDVIENETPEPKTWKIYSRDAFKDVSPEFVASFQRTSSGGYGGRACAHFELAAEAARTLGCLEPLVWEGFRRQGAGITRRHLRVALDVISANPSLITLRMNDVPGDQFADAVFATAQLLWGRRFETSERADRLPAVCWMAIVKGMVAWNQVALAKDIDAFVPVLTRLSPSRNASEGVASVTEAKNTLAGVGLFLRELQYWPGVETLADVIRVRTNRHFAEFRHMLHIWLAAIQAGDKSRIAELRREVARANAALSSTVRCDKIGRFFTYVGLPLIVVDAVIFPVFGAAATIGGFGVQAYADWQRAKNGWALVGR
jgi:hypothetical protein